MAVPPLRLSNSERKVWLQGLIVSRNARRRRDSDLNLEVIQSIQKCSAEGYISTRYKDLLIRTDIQERQFLFDT